MKVITFLNEKGGVAKTTKATTAACNLALRGYRTLLIDSDAQGHATISMGLKKEPALYDMLVREANLADVIKTVPYSSYGPRRDIEIESRLAIIPSNVETRNIPNSMSNGFYFAQCLEQLEAHFDYVIIDTSPTPSLLHTSIYVATDYIVYPTKLEALSLDGLFSSISHLNVANKEFKKRNLRVPVKALGILPTITELGTVEHSENFAYLAENDVTKDLLMKPIAKRTIWREATAAKMSIFAYAPQSNEATIAHRMVEELLERMA